MNASQEKTPEQLRDEAQGIVAASLAITTGQAAQQIRQLNDEEVAEISAVGSSVLQRREVVKAVMGRAYDRRREAAAADAKKKVSAAAQTPAPPSEPVDQSPETPSVDAT